MARRYRRVPADPRGPAAGRNLRLDDLVRLAQDAGFAVTEQALVGRTVKAACVAGHHQVQPADPEGPGGRRHDALAHVEGRAGQASCVHQDRRLLRALDQDGVPLGHIEQMRVRTPSGVEGWVLSRFLMQGRAARDQLADAEKKLARLELENRKLTASLEGRPLIFEDP